jgi:cation:H+ antiporter
MPEMIVSLLAAISGNTEIAIGNVLGSNIANIFLILGLTAVIAPVALSRTTRFFDLPVSIIVTLLLALLASDMFFDNTPNMIGRIDGLILFAGAILFTLYALKHNNLVPDESEEVEVVQSP